MKNEWCAPVKNTKEVNDGSGIMACLSIQYSGESYTGWGNTAQ